MRRCAEDDAPAPLRGSKFGIPVYNAGRTDAMPPVKATGRWSAAVHRTIDVNPRQNIYVLLFGTQICATISPPAKCLRQMKILVSALSTLSESTANALPFLPFTSARFHLLVLLRFSLLWTPVAALFPRLKALRFHRKDHISSRADPCSWPPKWT
ncbi:hypothetical protein PLICRDRAFT_470999 [Plicaturopsis crispa FD-325 SS-3]|nr:hypothetical protein PLICRDRAFT_470999 [Plicaturopsis crispa FD-325 SS-3]